VVASVTYPHPDKLELYKKLAATNPDIQINGAGVPNTTHKGHMFSYLTKEGKLALRLPDVTREQFLKKHKANLCSAYGRAQPEYVEVPDALLANTAKLQPYFAASFDYVNTLKAKKAK
jgi:hypothetical protein